jgi:hypothetical protein
MSNWPCVVALEYAPKATEKVADADEWSPIETPPVEDAEELLPTAIAPG